MEDQKRLKVHNESFGSIGYWVSSFYLYSESAWPLDFLFPGYTHYIFGFDHDGLKMTISISNKITCGIGEVKSLYFHWLSMDVSRYCGNSSNIQRAQRK